MSRVKTTVYAAAGALLLLTVTACSSNPGTPAPATSESSAAPPSSTSNVPKVSNPLDAAKYEQNPCALLSQAQATQLINSVRNRQAAGAVAPICSWIDADGNRIGLGLLPHQGGLASAYQHQDSQSGYFEAIPDINGYPAVLSGTTDSRKSGGCQAIVGIKDDETFTSSILLQPQSPLYQDPCSLAVKTAAAAITTIKAGT
ncbi:DUF3558 domain-containing protein [Amycolatopsis sp. Poz14]|uniref:DUF3558 domain-containing protein n=1 Tax=Amycolatopsis sp. Poz14 TaxID=1447705 RepID=UPI001EE78AFC|nr:DUF3558 domain-containing protein [Amycolatopsis sp. Poz14]MCG3757898.1 DUF3558 domain-containing protein [Amycolatopsis sp. Poz14]